MNDITLSSTVVIDCKMEMMDIDDSTLVSNGRSGIYGVELIARRIWEVLRLPSRVSELCELLLKEYDVDREICEQEVLEFLNDSMKEGLIRSAD